MIDVRTLTDGGQTALEIARHVSAFLDGSTRTLDLALYDIRLDGPEAQPVANALEHARARGVAIRILYNVDHPGPIPVPPPPETVPDLIEALPFPTKGIAGIPDLMHHKYAIRDGGSVLTGSANWTEDSWTYQENVIASVVSREIAAAYQADFEQLWTRELVEASGNVDAAPVDVDGTTVRAWFTPGRGTSLAHRIANRIDRAQRRVRICSPVITSGPILGTLAQVASDGKLDVAGAVDATQIQQVIQQWRANGNSAWKIPLLTAVLQRGDFTGKRSILWRPDSLHNFMHAKVTVCDDTVFLGSFNLSRSGELNAENVLEIRDSELADRLAAFIDGVRVLYPRVELPPA